MARRGAKNNSCGREGAARSPEVTQRIEILGRSEITERIEISERSVLLGRPEISGVSLAWLINSTCFAWVGHASAPTRGVALSRSWVTHG